MVHWHQGPLTFDVIVAGPLPLHKGYSLTKLRSMLISPWSTSMHTGATCDVCRRFFWTSQRLQQHLAHIPTPGIANPCSVELVRRGATPDAFARVIMPADKTGLNSCDALLTCGPDGTGFLQSQQERQCQQLKADIDMLEQSLDRQTFRTILDQEDLSKFWAKLGEETNVW